MLFSVLTDRAAAPSHLSLPVAHNMTCARLLLSARALPKPVSCIGAGEQSSSMLVPFWFRGVGQATPLVLPAEGRSMLKKENI